MTKRIASSRTQFERYKTEFLSRNGQSQEHHRRDRSSWALIRSFFGLLRGQWAAITLALTTLTVATLLALISPAATKFVVDYVLTGRPLPAAYPSWLPREPLQLLGTITIAVLAISMLKLTVHIWGRWHATRVTKRLQM